jgi:hypothetical protein
MFQDWLGRTTVSSHIPIETLLARLSELQASKRLLATCVNKIASGDDRLRLAQMYKVSRNDACLAEPLFADFFVFSPYRSFYGTLSYFKIVWYRN